MSVPSPYSASLPKSTDMVANGANIVEATPRELTFTLTPAGDSLGQVQVYFQYSGLLDAGQNPEVIARLQTKAPGGAVWLDLDVQSDDETLANAIVLTLNPVAGMSIMGNEFRLLVSVEDDSNTGQVVGASAQACYDNGVITAGAAWADA